jgi:alkylation response protein AidB-like acyl-CoA dehydrogenase
MWKQFAGLGLLAAPLPEAYGGLGGGAQDVLVIQEEFGKALVVEPFLPVVVLAGGLIARAGSEAQKQELLNGIASGERLVVLAHGEQAARYNRAFVETSAKKQGAGYVLSGQKSLVLGAPHADTLIVSARTSGAVRDTNGISLFVVPKSAAGVSSRDYVNVDDTRASEITLENVAVGADALLGGEGEGLALLDHALDEAIAAHAGEAVGVMRTLHAATLDYAKTRQQFGQPIGSFQVIQHRLVDMFIELEQAASLAYLATLKLDTPERARAASMAKAGIGKGARSLGEAAVQVHGGMGMTEEVRASHYFKRLTVMASQFGDTNYHLRRLGQL